MEHSFLSLLFKVNNNNMCGGCTGSQTSLPPRPLGLTPICVGEGRWGESTCCNKTTSYVCPPIHTWFCQKPTLWLYNSWQHILCQTIWAHWNRISLYLGGWLEVGYLCLHRQGWCCNMILGWWLLIILDYIRLLKK